MERYGQISIFSLLQLESLFLQNNLIEKIPKDIAKLQRLKILDLSHNHIEKLEHINAINFLEVLNISFNKISELNVQQK